VQTRERFEDVGGYRDNDAERRWRGIFRITARVLRGGRLVDVCSARTRWRVLRRVG
jgi:hypothetical protein